LKLKEKLYTTVQEAIDVDCPVICLGDLFDTFDTDNTSLLAGIDTYKKCALTLFGNHDLSNRVDLLSSIEVADYLENGEDTFRHSAKESWASCKAIDGLEFWFVDHKLTQDVFEGALDHALDHAKLGDVLLLHSNYDSPFATQESTLNLTRDKAETLLTKFSYIFMGHEHASKEDFDGRLILLGNTHPTGFSDISDKFVWDIEIEADKITSIQKQIIWSADEGHLVVDWTDLSELESIGSKVEFLEVKGVADQQHMPLIASQVAALWNLSPNLLMVRNNVTATGGISLVEVTEHTRCQSVPERISTELAGTKLQPLWNNYLEAL